MDLNLKHEKLVFVKTLCENSFTHEETMEVIVPDAQPDVLRIISADGNVLLRSKDYEPGRVSVSGTINATVLYCPEGENCVRKIDAAIPFSAVSECIGITPDSLIVATVSLVSISAATINPRKLNICANLLVNVSVFEYGEKNLCTAVQETEGCGIEALPGKCEICGVSSVKEKTFVVSDEFTMPASKPPFCEILRSTVDTKVEDVKSVGSKLIIKGVATLCVIYSSERNNEVCSVEFSTVFSQILEMDSADENQDVDVQLMLTGMYVNENSFTSADSQAINMELHLVAQCVSRSCVTVSYISDLYSTSHELNPTVEALQLPSFVGSSEITETLRGNIAAEHPVQNIISSTARLSPVTASPAGDRLELSVSAEAYVLYLSEDGDVHMAAHRFTVTSGLDMAPGCTYGAKAHIMGELFVSLADGGFDFRVPVMFKVDQTKTDAVTTVVSASCSDEPVKNQKRPSIIVCRSREGDTFWSLGKKYMSTEELIFSANTLDEGSTLAPDTFLIIPRKR